MKDIEIKDDLVKLIDLFYVKLIADERVSPFFKNLDLEHHLPRVVDFWSFVLLDETGYSTNVIEKHMNLRLKEEHFTIWLNHFNDSCDELFSGPKADLAKERANLVGLTMKFKIINAAN